MPDHDLELATTVELSDGWRRHFVVCGDNPLAYRLAAKLVSQHDGHVTVILKSATENWGPQIRALVGVDVVEASRLDAAAFLRAGLEHAAALAIVEQEDAGNVDAALVAQELNPDVRIVIRMFNLRLGDRMGALLNNCAVLSAAAIAAPAFIAAALDETTTAPITVADRTLVATPRGRADPSAIICGLAVTAGPGEPRTLPPDSTADTADLVLIESKPAPVAKPRRRRRRRGAVHLLPILVGTKVRIALATLLGLFLAATAVLASVKDLPWTSAAYLALLSELGGADADAHAAGLEKVTFVVLTLVSLALIPALTAAVVDGVVKARLRIESGALVDPIENHLVVVGLGDVGTRVIRALHNDGIEVVAIERNSSARGIQIARDLDIPVIIGDASRAEVLQAASVRTCRALVVVSTDDVSNLEIALLGRAEKPDLRVVLRLFDGDFARRVQRTFAINISRSVSYLAAPAFAAAMLGRQVIATIAVRRHVLLVAEVPIGAGSALEHQPTSSVNRDHQVRLLAVRTGEPEQIVWRPSGDQPLRRTDQLVVVATRVGLSELLSDTTTPTNTPPTPYRPIGSWQLPHPRTGGSNNPPTEEPPAHRPFGPEDCGSTRPA